MSTAMTAHYVTDFSFINTTSCLLDEIVNGMSVIIMLWVPWYVKLAKVARISPSPKSLVMFSHFLAHETLFFFSSSKPNFHYELSVD
jgi:hypothetical protein